MIHLPPNKQNCVFVSFPVLMRLLLQHMQMVHSAYLIQPRKKDALKVLLKLLAQSKYSPSSLKVSQSLHYPVIGRCSISCLNCKTNLSIFFAESLPEGRPGAVQPHRPQPVDGRAGRIPRLLPQELGFLHQGNPSCWRGLYCCWRQSWVPSPLVKKHFKPANNWYLVAVGKAQQSVSTCCGKSHSCANSLL